MIMVSTWWYPGYMPAELGGVTQEVLCMVLVYFEGRLALTESRCVLACQCDEGPVVAGEGA